MGKIEVFLGPMFAGKTTSIIKRVKELEKDGKKVRIFKPAVDDRYGSEVICTHDKVSLKAYNIKAVEEAKVDDADVVVFDEYFFFRDNLLNYCKRLKDEDKHVILAGLETDYLGNPMKFVDSEKGSEDIKKIADEIHYLKSKCSVCGKDATMTERTASSEDNKLVGGAEAYRPVCKEHHPKWKR